MNMLSKTLSLVTALVISIGAYAQEEKESAKNFMEVTAYPVAPGCEDIEDQEESFKCFTTLVSRHVATNFRYPEEARRAGQQGRAFVNFIIERDGSVGEVSLARTSGVASIDEAALQAVRSLPKMDQPAFLDGRSVRMQYTVPINARFQ